MDNKVDFPLPGSNYIFRILSLKSFKFDIMSDFFEWPYSRFGLIQVPSITFRFSVG